MNQRVCPRCDGDGEVPMPDHSGAATATCPTCHGVGRLNVGARKPAPAGPQ